MQHKYPKLHVKIKQTDILEDLGIKSTRTIQSTYNGYINQKICLTCPNDRKMYYDI